MTIKELIKGLEQLPSDSNAEWTKQPSPKTIYYAVLGGILLLLLTVGMLARVLYLLDPNHFPL